MSWRSSSPRQRSSCSTSGSRPLPASWRATVGSAPCARRSRASTRSSGSASLASSGWKRRRTPMSETQQGSEGSVANDAELSRGYRKVREGLVVSDKMDKTVVVEVEDRVKHPKYGKVIRRTKKYKAHDEKNECGVGDRVLLMETRPLSATKRWRVAGILERAK